MERCANYLSTIGRYASLLRIRVEWVPSRVRLGREGLKGFDWDSEEDPRSGSRGPGNSQLSKRLSYAPLQQEKSSFPSWGGGRRIARVPESKHNKNRKQNWCLTFIHERMECEFCTSVSNRVKSQSEFSRTSEWITFLLAWGLRMRIGEELLPRKISLPPWNHPILMMRKSYYQSDWEFWLNWEWELPIHIQ